MTEDTMKNIDSWVSKQYPTGTLAEMSVAKAAPMLSSTTGMFNPLYGAMAFFNGNNEANAYNILPKTEWGKSGWRLRTGRGFTLGTGGVADGGAIADTVMSTIVEVSTTPKISHITFEIGVMTDLLDGDDRYTFEEEIKAKAEDHIKDINTQLLTDCDTPPVNNFESIDRVCSSQAESALLCAVTDTNIYGLDRSASTAYDAYVDHNSGVDRALTTTMIRTLISTIQKNSGKRPNVILTGYDTYEKIAALFESQTRYFADARVTVGFNGIQTEAGSDVGIGVQAVLQVPVLLDDSVVVDTISRIYALNTESLELSIAKATQFTVSDNQLDRGTLTKKAMYMTIGELKCNNFTAQGKIRDLL
jgi:hypothetical protein